MQVERNNCQIGNSYAVGRAGNNNKYSGVSEYYAYLESKYPCLTDSGYKVTISQTYLEKCINDPECAELLEKNLAHLPVSHQNMTSFWSARGAEVINEQWNFDENGNCGGGTNMYVVSKDSTSSNSVHNKMSKKRTEKEFTPQVYYEKRKHIRELFEERQAKKERLRERFEEKQAEQEIEHSRLTKSWYSESRIKQAFASYEAFTL